jgi:hypothetical protein
VTVNKNDQFTLVLVAGLMVTDKELDELYRPYDTLKSIGFSTDEAKSFLAGIANAAKSQTITEPKAETERVVKYTAQRSELRRLRSKTLLLVVWGYAFAVWLYVTAMQLLHPESINWTLATWLPIRLDYVGEAAFVFSFIVATAVTMWNTRLSLKTGRNITKPNADSSA